MIEKSQSQMVILVDRDPVTRTQLSASLQSRRLPTSEFESIEACVNTIEMLSPDISLCVITELDLLGSSGLRLQNRLNEMNKAISTIFYAQRACTQEVVSAIQNGAITVIEKSEGPDAVLSHLDTAFEVARRNYESAEQRRIARSQLRTLSPGEQDVLDGILNGKLNKEIAQQLNLSVRTIEQRRRQVFNKLDVQHPASLAQKVIQASQSLKNNSGPIGLGLPTFSSAPVPV